MAHDSVASEAEDRSSSSRSSQSEDESSARTRKPAEPAVAAAPLPAFLGGCRHGGPTPAFLGGGAPTLLLVRRVSRRASRSPLLRTVLPPGAAGSPPRSPRCLAGVPPPDEVGARWARWAVPPAPRRRRRVGSPRAAASAQRRVMHVEGLDDEGRSRQ